MSHVDPFLTAEYTAIDAMEYPGPLLQAEEFERVEDKYLVPVEYRDELLELLYRKSRPSYLTPDTHFLGIESVYFESPDFQSFHDHFQSKPYRYKLRTRRYAPNGLHVDDDTHIELKSKDGETTRKFRFKLSGADLSRIRDFLPIRLSSDLVGMNPAIPGAELSRRARQISRLVAEKTLRPLCRVEYQRQAFERKGVRVTVDSNITSELLRPLREEEVFGELPLVRTQASLMAANYLSANHVLLEIKHRGFIPKWLDAFTLARTRGKIGFSKYCFSITQQLLHPHHPGRKVED